MNEKCDNKGTFRIIINSPSSSVTKTAVVVSPRRARSPTHRFAIHRCYHIPCSQIVPVRLMMRIRRKNLPYVCQELSSHFVVQQQTLLCSKHPSSGFPCRIGCKLMSSFWADVCSASRDRSMQQQIDAARASCGVMVLRLLLLSIIQMLFVTFCSDRCLLHERFSQPPHVLSVEAHRRGESTAHLAAVRASLPPLR